MMKALVFSMNFRERNPLSGLYRTMLLMNPVYPIANLKQAGFSGKKPGFLTWLHHEFCLSRFILSSQNTGNKLFDQFTGQVHSFSDWKNDKSEQKCIISNFFCDFSIWKNDFSDHKKCISDWKNNKTGHKNDKTNHKNNKTNRKNDKSFWKCFISDWKDAVSGQKNAKIDCFCFHSDRFTETLNRLSKLSLGFRCSVVTNLKFECYESIC